MSQKRQPEAEAAAGSSDGRPGEKRRRGAGAAFRDLVMEALRMDRLQTLLSALEPLLRRIVREEVERALGKNLNSIKRQCGNQVHPSSSGSLQLQFRTMLCHPIFTGSKIEGEDSSSICVALVDSLTGDVVTTGPESSLKVEIVVLEGDYEGDKEENWSVEDFKSNIIKERDGKRTLLVGDVLLDLKEGTAFVSDLSFTDNSSWTRSRKFRLGARVDNGYFNGVRIKEAKTEPFTVKDHRGELYKKHYPPSLDDDVWRLEKIGKDGAYHKRLSKEKIHTVKDFLTLLSIDSVKLRNILQMSSRMWETTVEHARTCILGNQMYVYYEDCQQKNGVLFNAIGEMSGVTSEQQYIPLVDLSDTQKVEALNLVKVAFECPRKICPFDVEKTMHGPSLAPSPFHSGSPPLGDNFCEQSSYQKADIFGVSLPIVSTPDIQSLDNFGLQAMDAYSPCTFGFLQHDVYKPGPVLYDEDSSSHVFKDNRSHYFGSDHYYQLDNFSPSSPAELSNTFPDLSVRHLKISRKWRTVSSVLGWLFYIKRIAALKRSRAPKKG